MKKKRSKLISDIVLFITAVVLLYPMGADIYNSSHLSAIADSYTETVSGYDENQYQVILKQIDIYNSNLTESDDRFIDEKNNVDYFSLLNVSGNMAFISFEKIGVKNIPVAHGTNTKTLQEKAGHIPGSSFPSDKSGIHIAVSGHTGMSGLKMFSGLRRAELGDTFELIYLNRKLIYQVDQIKVVLPNDMSPLKINSKTNYCSLVTCTPIGVNSHRLVVRGKLVDVQPVTDKNPEKETTPEKTHTISLLTIKNFVIRVFNRFEIYQWVMAGTALVIFVFVFSDLRKIFKKRKVLSHAI